MRKIPIYTIRNPTTGKEEQIVDLRGPSPQEEKLMRIIEDNYINDPEYQLFITEKKIIEEKEEFMKLVNEDTGYSLVRVIDPITGNTKYEQRKFESLGELVKEFEKEPSMDKWIRVYERYWQIKRPSFYFS